MYVYMYFSILLVNSIFVCGIKNSSARFCAHMLTSSRSYTYAMLLRSHIFCTQKLYQAAIIAISK